MPARLRLHQIVVIALLTTNFWAQQTKVLAPHRQAPPKLAHPVKWHDPAVMRSMVGGFWMIDANYKSTIYLKNNVETDAITVTPILYLSNGRRYSLQDLTIEPAGVATLSINQALSSLGIASWATLTGYVELSYVWPWNALCASVENVDVAHSVIFSSGFHASVAGASNATGHPAALKHQVLVGMWWKQEPGVSGFVALSNTASQPTRVTVQVSDSQNDAITEQNVTVSPHGTKTVALNELAQSSASFGGIRIAYDGMESGLIVNGVLDDQSVGYSSAIPFGPEIASSAKPQRQAYAELGLMVGAADPMMSFPAGTTFAPYSILRNISATSITITPTLWWMEHSEARSRQLPQFQIPRNTTEALDVPSLMSLAGLRNFSGNVNLQFDVLGPAGGLLMAAGSVDQKNTYVFEVRPSAIEESQARSLSYWDTANGDDTMVTVWNPADETQDFVFRLSFTGGHYNFPLHLGPRGSQTFNISEVINNQIPDAEGNVVPTSVHAGSADLEGTQGDNQDILVAMEAGTYNVIKATCIMRCVTCHGATSFWTQAAPFAVAVSAQKQLNAIVQYGSGSQSDLTTTSSWSSNSTSVATVSSGLVHGVFSGSVNVIATSPTETQAGTDCQEYTPPLVHVPQCNPRTQGG